MATIDLKKQMAKKNVTMVELSREINVSEAVLRNLCTGKNESIRFDIIDKLCDYFDCSPNSIIKITKLKEGGIKEINYSDSLKRFKCYLDSNKFKIYHCKIRKAFEIIYKSVTEVISKNMRGNIVDLFDNGQYIGTYDKTLNMIIKVQDAKENTFYDSIIDQIVEICNKNYLLCFIGNNREIAKSLITGVIESVVYHKKYLKN